MDHLFEEISAAGLRVSGLGFSAEGLGCRVFRKRAGTLPGTFCVWVVLIVLREVPQATLSLK